MIANIVTISRIPFSICLFVLSPASSEFVILYLLCGLSDILDGFLARNLHTESKTGEFLDSVADLFFAAVYAIKILPFLRIPVWLLIWTAIIAATKIAGIIIASRKEHRLKIAHSLGNKLTGLLIFLLPLSVYILDVKYGASVVGIAATVTAIMEIRSVK